MNQDQPSWIGHTLHARYKIESLLGSGGMATVYKGFDPNLRRHVAIKLIHEYLAQQPEFVRRFEQEAAAVAKLRHPNIVPVYDFNHDRDVYYMVLAYLTGGNLKERLEDLHKSGQRLPLSETIYLMIKLCEAVDYAHERHLIHRDIKPANVLFDENGQPYLTDFGVVRLAADQQTMTVVGTPAYMSPEQIRGDQLLDKRTDIYSLGIMLYEMAGGRPPFEGGLGTLMLKHMQEPLPNIRLFNYNIPDALVTVIEKGLAKKPSDRFQSAAEMASALRAVDLRATGGATSGPKGSGKVRLPKKWSWAIGILLAAVVIIAAMVFSRPPDQPVTPTSTVSEPSAVSSKYLQEEDGIRNSVASRGLGNVSKRQHRHCG